MKPLEIKLALAKMVPGLIEIYETDIGPMFFLKGIERRELDWETQGLWVADKCEKKLTAEQQVLYVERLESAIMDDSYEGVDYYKQSRLCARELTFRASFDQRAEALLRTLGRMKTEAHRLKVCGWWEEYSCGCTSETVQYKKDLLGYCKTHGHNRRQVFRELQKPKAPNDEVSNSHR